MNVAMCAASFRWCFHDLFAPTWTSAWTRDQCQLVLCCRARTSLKELFFSPQETRWAENEAATHRGARPDPFLCEHIFASVFILDNKGSSDWPWLWSPDYLHLLLAVVAGYGMRLVWRTVHESQPVSLLSLDARVLHASHHQGDRSEQWKITKTKNWEAKVRLKVKACMGAVKHLLKLHGNDHLRSTFEVT